MDVRYQIRRASVADVPAVAAIEQACFSDPWSPAGLAETIQYGTARTFVAENQAGVVGYIMARISGEEGEILNLAVLPRDRRQGIARRLLATGLEALLTEGVREAYLEVRESNEPAITLYRSAGFRPVGLRPDYYRNPPEDALVLRAPIGVLRD
jgi:ribosomal-protein-alanine N-acetyltransferase